MRLVACTEPNPYLPVDESGDASTIGGEPTTSTATIDPTAEPTDSGTSGGETACALQGMTCVAAAPEGFAGPFAWLERPTDAPLDCPAPFAQSSIEAFSELSAPAATCACACGPFGAATCSSAALVRHADDSCDGGVQSTLDLQDGCTPVAGAGWATNTSFFFDAAEVTGGGCVPLPSTERLPATFLTRHLACEAPLVAEGCDPGQLCAPRPDDPLHARFCVWQEGDVACPEDGAYSERTLLHRDIEDERGCEPCSCTPPTAACTDTVALSTALDCGVLSAFVTPDGCLGAPGGPNFRSVLYEEGEVPEGLECEPAVVVPTGDAAGIDPVTFCCTR